jgi:hypothetical protein
MGLISQPFKGKFWNKISPPAQILARVKKITYKQLNLTRTFKALE